MKPLPRDRDAAIRLPATDASIETAGARVDAILSALGVSRERALRIELALEELLVNIVSYAYPADGPGDFEILIAPSADAITLTVTDWGRPFNPLEADPPRTGDGIDDREPGGLGIHLVRELARSVRYERAGDANRIAFTFPTGGTSG
ncbi:MAG TPA: ATP-binding protein [Spirochaetota bacterium]|nr:ATP-binding protein [Spirochaetota bacterium]HOS38606.1 ATP-binding protein [Spirochaetota bacterium]HPU87288.1 ATP-binding protein [Spirochaetota bacterium]